MKKLGTLLLTLCMIFSLLLVPVQAGACETQMSVAVAQMDAIEACNASWYQTDPQTQAGLRIVETANRRIREIIVESCRMAEKTDNKVEIAAIIVSMCVRTRVVSATAQAAAELCGVQTVCEYVAVEIGGHTVMVDPLRVVLV